ncbi:MAG: histidine phosphatase family protein [Eubacterium sp.]|nr:histidine phosphatase family protein [Eubacterium sp.]
MEIMIVRHGTTLWNEKKKLQGSVDIELNAAGIEVAQLTAKGMESLSFDRIYSSPLKRAYKTAEIIRDKRDIPIITDERLKEINFGNYEGKNGLALQEDQTSGFRFFFKEPEKYYADGGEELTQLCQRTKEFLQREIEPLKGRCDRILIVGHGAMNKAMMCHILNHGLEQFWSGGLQKNCGVIILRLDDKGYHLIEENAVFY